MDRYALRAIFTFRIPITVGGIRVLVLKQATSSYPEERRRRLDNLLGGIEFVSYCRSEKRALEISQ